MKFEVTLIHADNEGYLFDTIDCSNINEAINHCSAQHTITILPEGIDSVRDVYDAAQRGDDAGKRTSILWGDWSKTEKPKKTNLTVNPQIEHVGLIIRENLLDMGDTPKEARLKAERINKEGWTFDTSGPTPQSWVRHEGVVLSSAGLERAFSFALSL